jgi:hypothetical protein
MNKTLKWVLIALGIALVAFLVALPLFGMHRFGFSMMPRYSGFERGFPMMGFMPMMAFRLVRGLIGLGIFALAVTGVVLLVRGANAKKVAPPAPVETTPIVEPVTNCGNCGKEIKVGWVACPYCGKKQ